MNLGRYPEAESQSRLSAAERRALWDANPTVLRYGDDLANEMNNQARILRRMGRLDEAEIVFQSSIGIYERLARDVPTIPLSRHAGSHFQ